MAWPLWTEVIPERCDNWRRCRNELKPSWHPTLQVDHSDGHTRVFRQSLPALLILVVISAGLTALVRWLRRGASHVALQGTIGFFFSLYIFGPIGAPITWALVLFWFAATRAVLAMTGPSTARYAAPALAWSLAAAALLGAEYAKTVRFRGFVSRVPGLHLLGYLDGLWSGEMPWYLVVNMLVLRLISFTMDAQWSGGAVPPGPAKDPPPDQYNWASPALARVQAEGPAYKARVATPRPAGEYASPALLFAYAFYPPLLLSGPTTTFNAWASHLSKAQTSYSPSQLALYCARWAACFGLLEVAMHWSPLFAFVKHRVFLALPLPPVYSAGMSWMHLNYLWLKFLVLWRFHRGWALLEGFETPENMTVCVNNNFTIKGFWRGWHRSYNQWLVRYIYIPLGGSRVPLWRQLFNIAVVFTFVALWHDMTAQLLAWGWILVLGMAPELAAGAWAGSQHWAAVALRDSRWMRVLVGLGGAVNILALVLANFIGYSASPEAAMGLLREVFLLPAGGLNLPLILAMFAVLYSAVQLMLLRQAQDEDTSLRLLAWPGRSPKTA